MAALFSVGKTPLPSAPSRHEVGLWFDGFDLASISEIIIASGAAVAFSFAFIVVVKAWAMGPLPYFRSVLSFYRNLLTRRSDDQPEAKEGKAEDLADSPVGDPESIFDTDFDDNPSDPNKSGAMLPPFMKVAEAKEEDMAVREFFNDVASLDRKIRDLLCSVELAPGAVSTSNLANALSRCIVLTAEKCFRLILNDEGCFAYIVTKGGDAKTVLLYYGEEASAIPPANRPANFAKPDTLSARGTFPGRAFETGRIRYLPDTRLPGPVADEVERRRLEENGTHSAIALPVKWKKKRCVASIVVESTKSNALCRKCRLQRWFLDLLTEKIGLMLQIAEREKQLLRKTQEPAGGQPAEVTG